MPKRLSLEDKLADLKRLRGLGPTPEALSALRKALGDRSNLIVAKAADIAAELDADAEPLVEALASAFPRFLSDPVKTDKLCRAKIAIVEAFVRLEAWSDEVYLRGIRHVQFEPSFGGPVDTAPRLRGLCGMGLARMGHPQTMNELARLLADGEGEARVLAARAIACSGDVRGEPLLRYKAHVGDRDAQVLAECLLGLLRLEPEDCLSFVAECLDSRDAGRVEAAAVALGESRLDKALPLLAAACERTVDPDSRQTFLHAVAALRSDAAVEFLLTRLADAEGRTARSVLAALTPFRHDPAVLARAGELIDRKRDRELSEAFRKHLAP